MKNIRYCLCGLFIIIFQSINLTSSNAQSIIIDTGMEEVEATTGNEIIACNGLLLRLRVEGISNITAYNWNFGNGNTSVLPNPVEQYNTVGKFTISVEVTANGTTQTLSSPIDFIEISQVNEVNVLVNQTDFCLNDNLIVRNDAPLGTFSEVRYLVDNQLYQGDVSQAGAPATIPLNKAGQFSIAMEGTHTEGCRFIENYNGLIEVIPPFEIRISPEKTVSCEDDIFVQYTAAVIDENGNEITDNNIQYDWDFGDGWQGLGKTLLHNYTRTSGKAFNIQVTASSPAGCTNTIEIENALFFLDQTEGFDFNSLNPPYCSDYGAIEFRPLLEDELNGTQLVWRFEDGSIKRSIYPEGVSHRFLNNTSGTRTENVVMEIEDGATFGCRFIKPIEIPILSRGEISLADTVFCQSPFVVSPLLRNDASVGNWYWRIQGDTQKYGINERAPQITVNTIGSFTLELVAEEGTNSCVLDSVQIRSEIPDFEIVGNDGGCLPFDGIYRIPDIENVTIANINWSLIQLENGIETNIATSTDRDFLFSINNDGNYKVEAFVKTTPIGNNPSCEFTLEKNVDIRILPTLDFEILPDSTICNESTVTFRNLSSFGNINNPYADSIKYEWDYTGGDNYVGAINSQGDGQFQYDLAEPFVFINVRLRAYYEGYDCEERILEKQIQILPPKAEFEITNDECSPTLLQIENTSIGGTRFDWEFIIDGNAFSLTTFNINDDPTQHPNFPTFNGNPKGILPSEAFVEVSMTATEGACIDNFSSSVQLKEEVGLPQIINTPDEVCIGKGAFFEGSELPVDAAYRWTFTHEDGNTTVLEFGSYNTIIFTKAGRWEGLYEVLLSPTCIRKVPIPSFIVRGTSFSLEGEKRLCEGDSIKIEVEDIWTTSNTIEWQWLYNGQALETGTSTNGTIPDLQGFYPIEARFPQSESQKITLNVFTDSCEWKQDFNFNITYPDFDLENIRFEYGCDGIETKISPTLGSKGFLLFPFPSFQWQIFDGTNWIDTFEDDFDYQFPDKLTFTFKFDEGEAYQIRLLVTDSYGCSSIQETTLEVPTSNLPKADFSADVFSLDCPGFISFTDLANGTDGNSTPRIITENNTDTEVPIVRWLWDFGDGNTATTLTGEVAHFYQIPSPPNSAYEVSLTIEEELPNGRICRHTSEIKEVTVGGVLGNFEIEKFIFYGEDEIDLTATIETANVNPNDITFTWTSGDGQGGNTFPIQKFNYTIPDSVNLKTAIPALSFTDQDGCVTTAKESGTISILNCPNLSFQDTTLCASENITVTLSDINFIDFYEWEEDEYKAQIEGRIYYQWFADGNLIAEGEGLSSQEFVAGTSTPNAIDPLDVNGENITVKYWVISDYTDFVNPTKSVNNQISCEKEMTFNIRFRPSPTASFESSPQTGLCGEGTFRFDASQSLAGQGYQIDAYQWDFGDGNTASGEIVTHEFLNDSSYNIQLIIQANSGCSDTLTQEVRILPVPEFELSSQIDCGTYEVAFFTTLQNQNVPSDSVQLWEWDFNYDGISPQIDRSGQALDSLIFDYEASGFGVEQYHKVWVKATTFNGCTDSVVLDIPIFRFNAPQADFEVSAPKICISEIISFTDLSTVDNQNISSLIPSPLPIGTNEINAWEWQFGDDSVSNLQNPQHQYQNVGNYNVKLKVSSERGCTDSLEFAIKVKENPFTELVDSITNCELFLDTIWAENLSNPDWEYEWRKIAETGGSIQESSVRTDRIGLAFDAFNFENDSPIIESQFVLRTYDPELSTACEDIDTLSVRVFRFPEIDGFTHNDTIYIPNCATSASIQAMQNPLSDYQFNWIVQATNGRVEAQSLNTPNLDINVVSFEDGQDQLFVSAIVEVTNQSVICKHRKTINFHFLRKPIAEIIADQTEVAESETINLQSDYTSLNSVYTWNQLSANPSNANITENIQDENLSLLNPTFPNGELRVDFVYELVVSNQDCEERDTISVSFFKEPTFELRYDSSGVCFEEESILFPDQIFQNGFLRSWERISVSDQDGNPQEILENGNLNGLNQQNTGFDSLRLFVPSMDQNISRIDAVYTLKISNSLNENIAVSDTARISFYNKPNLLNLDTIFRCEANEVSILENLTENSAYEFEWSITEIEGGIANLENTNTFNPSLSNLNFEADVNKMILTLNRIGRNIEKTDCQISEEIKVLIEPSIDAVFQIRSENSCELDQITFDRSMTDLPFGYRWEWDFNNDRNFETASDSLIFIRSFSEGNHIFSARTLSPNGCYGEIYQQEIQIQEIFKPEIKLLSQACIDEEIQIELQSNYPSSEIQSIQWDLNYHAHLGENFTENGVSITHQFSEVGIYRIFVQLQRINTCIDTLSQLIEIGERPQASISAPVYVCYGENYTLEASGGTSYLWANSQTSPQIQKRAEVSTWEKVEVFSSANCSDIDSVFVQVSPNTFIQDTLYKCFGESLEIDARRIVGEGTAVSFTWDTGENEAIISINQPNTYRVNVETLHPSGANCTYVGEFIVLDHAPLETLSEVIEHCFEDNQEVTISAPIYQNVLYEWQDTRETSPSVIRNEVGEYVVWMTDISIPLHCTTKQIFSVEDVCENRMFAPDAFTPNKDGINDYFFLETAYTAEITLQIFNRWGEVIFERKYENAQEASIPENGWDGTYRGKLMPIGVYTFTISYSSLGVLRQNFQKSGRITLAD